MRTTGWGTGMEATVTEVEVELERMRWAARTSWSDMCDGGERAKERSGMVAALGVEAAEGVVEAETASRATRISSCGWSGRRTHWRSRRGGSGTGTGARSYSVKVEERCDMADVERGCSGGGGEGDEVRE